MELCFLHSILKAPFLVFGWGGDFFREHEHLRSWDPGSGRNHQGNWLVTVWLNKSKKISQFPINRQSLKWKMLIGGWRLSRKIFTVKLKLFHHHMHVRFNYCAYIMFYEQDPPTCRALQRIGHPPAHPPHVTPTKHKQKIRHLSINRARPRGHKTQTNSLLISVLSFCYIYIFLICKWHWNQKWALSFNAWGPS